MNNLNAGQRDALIILIGALLFIHYGIERHQTALLMVCYSVAFLGYLYLLKNALSTRWIIFSGIALRLILFFGMPTLSEDIYRFLWDGHLLHLGIHPFSATPEEITQSSVSLNSTMTEIYPFLNSSAYYTIYPPLSQAVFWLSTFAQDIWVSVTLTRLILFLFEIGTLLMLRKMAANPQTISIYALNPLVILELIGNLHFEGMLVFFTLLSMHFLNRQRILGSAIGLAAGIATKLSPLMFLPSLLVKMDWKKTLAIYVLILLALTLCSYLLIDWSLLMGMSQSLSLFFKKFEFNAGLFFIFREIGFLIAGYDMIYWMGPLMSAIALILILFVSLKSGNKKSYSEIFGVVILIQLLFATTVHPWYIIPLIALAVLNNHRFPIVWSFLIFLTYSGYSFTGYEHVYWIMGIEYLIVFYWVWHEVIQKNKVYEFLS